MKIFAARLERSNQLLSEYQTFARKAVDELKRMHQNAEMNRSTDNLENENEDEEPVEKFMWNEINLLGLGGTTYRERLMNIANTMWTADERLKYCIEPRKLLIGERQPADEERTTIFRDVMMKVMKRDFSEDRFRSILKYVNQQGCDIGKRKRKSDQKENESPRVSEVFY